MSGDLKWNKIFGAGLGTAFAILVVQQVSQAVYTTEGPEKAGYAVTVAEPTEGGEAAELAPDWGTLIPVADLAAGEAAFARCQGCHNVASGGANGIGPNLWAVVGRPVASHAGFAYSEAMAGHTSVDPTWSLDALDKFITAPARYVPGTKMSFAGLRDTEARVNLIAYLRSQGSAAAPIPAPDPTRQPGGAAPAAVPAEGAAPAAEGAEAVDGAAAPAAGATPAPAVPAAPAAAAAPAVPAA
ncbi:cytochrome c family protein [Brevundimonas sp. LM2]|uniref:c-type cytochrome n=1 Tax=Brevundimonas sp. LM2 TaxID=1938605 RepID=UPI00098399AF|nr:cytochrome c family protein [Brevundimonas sp. LM2]AQR60734.1 cytochrome c family protein [Brevundimonas sp. LM2]